MVDICLPAQLLAQGRDVAHGNGIAGDHDQIRRELLVRASDGLATLGSGDDEGLDALETVDTPLNELADMPPRTQPWLLVVMTSTYTSNPPSNAAAFKAWLERTAPGTGSSSSSRRRSI